jgi:hypothetical protein
LTTEWEAFRLDPENEDAQRFLKRLWKKRKRSAGE